MGLHVISINLMLGKCRFPNAHIQVRLFPLNRPLPHPSNSEYLGPNYSRGSTLWLMASILPHICVFVVLPYTVGPIFWKSVFGPQKCCILLGSQVLLLPVGK